MELNNTPCSCRSRKRKRGGAERTLTLPDEMIEEVLSRVVAVKSLLRFRCVSKSWLTLIKSKRFIEKHMKNSIRNKSLDGRSVMLVTKNGVWQCCALSLFNKPDIHALEPDFIITQNIEIVGCCNGVVCVLLNCLDFILWNPSTRISKRLQSLPRRPQLKPGTCYGFGYDELSGDYKVYVILVKVISSYVYSLKSDSWKTTKKEICLPSVCDGVGKFASGKLHWIHHQWMEELAILGLDVSREVVGRVELPPSHANLLHGNVFLGILDECISLISHRSSYIDVWVMKEYGVKESWQKVVALDMGFERWGDPPTLCTPLCSAPEVGDEILFVEKSDFLIYCKDGWYRRVGRPNLSYQQAQMYIQTLVPLD